MGSGKSTVGAALARSLKMPRLDADEVFESLHGPIPEFFARRGEPAFRHAEEEVIGQVLSRPEPCVISLGGGAVGSALTRSRLTGAHVVYLTVDEAVALRRLGGGEGRPVLAGDPGRTWRRILSEREALYREVSDWTVDTTDRSADQLAQNITRLVREAESISPTPGAVHP
jgi:shikimate kinase